MCCDPVESWVAAGPCYSARCCWVRLRVMSKVPAGTFLLALLLEVRPQCSPCCEAQGSKRNNSAGHVCLQVVKEEIGLTPGLRRPHAGSERSEAAMRCCCLGVVGAVGPLGGLSRCREWESSWHKYPPIAAVLGATEAAGVLLGASRLRLWGGRLQHQVKRSK